jgi:primase-polymerase (primpol)-like protein
MSFGAKFVVHLIDLYGLLAFWTNRDAERMDRLFRRSALMRQKWGSEKTTAGSQSGK